MSLDRIQELESEVSSLKDKVIAWADKAAFYSAQCQILADAIETAKHETTRWAARANANRARITELETALALSEEKNAFLQNQVQDLTARREELSRRIPGLGPYAQALMDGFEIK